VAKVSIPKQQALLLSRLKPDDTSWTNTGERLTLTNYQVALLKKSPFYDQAACFSQSQEMRD